MLTHNLNGGVIMFWENFQNMPLFRKLFFRKQVESEELFSMLTAQSSISGLSYFERRILISHVPEMEKIQEFHQNLCERLDAFIEEAQSRIPLSAVSKLDIRWLENAYAVKVFTYLSDPFPPAYLVYGVFFYRKYPNGKWVLQEKKPDKYDLGFTTERYDAHVTSSYPEDITISYCGGFGDVNYVSQKDFTFYEERFYATSPDSDLAVR